jgi:zinc-finger of transposase IS204/IS1001/IS1096/IS1165/Ferritin-like domain
LPSPTTGSWSPCAAGPAATAARAAAGLGGYDHSTRRWRHLDLAASKLWLEAEIWRVACRSCARIRTEAVPWARPGARLTRDLEDTTAAEIVAYATELEAGAARASIASVAGFEDRKLALLAAQIGGVEAQHWATLLAAVGANPVPSPIIELDGMAHTDYATTSTMSATPRDGDPGEPKG